MGKNPRITNEVLKVLNAISDAPDMSGAQIAKATGLSSGTLYPILLRLESAGWLESEWEDASPQSLGRPRRRYYQMTGVGRLHAASAAREMQQSIGRLAWS